MALTFYPHDEDLNTGTLKDKLEIVMEAAERYKAAVLDAGTTIVVDARTKKIVPKDLKIAFNWQEIAKILREIREMPENNTANKAAKADRLHRLAEVYEVLRGAKMPKLEAVRLALVNEAEQLKR